ncbi:LUD domain-containing protein (plasmid) [Haloferacaceae archaeon DSL9]
MSTKTSRSEKARRIRELMETEGRTLRENTQYMNEAKYDVTANFAEYEALKSRARAVKEDAIERLPELIQTLEEAVEANGGTVYLAADAQDANEYVESVCKASEGEVVVKSKSMTTEEIDLNEHLAEAGIEPVETDLGELVIQIAEEAPSHLVGPGIHKSREEIAALFKEVFDPEDPPETVEELTMFARDHLAERIAEADVGMTGANFVVAETGTIALVTNEGNARKVVEATNTHIAVAGVEKVIPTLADLQPFVELLGRSGTGQPITSYTSLFTPPIHSPTVPFEDPETEEREFHLVLLDNGRMRMRDDELLKETLYCIRCGACANSCANFQHVGGHAFGGETYTGGIATGWETGVHGLDSAAEFNDFCTGCTRCVPNCPVKIDIPWINTVVRDRANSDVEYTLDWLVDGLSPDVESGGPAFRKRLFGNFETLAKAGSATAPLSNWLADSAVGRSMLSRVGVHAERSLPKFERETFVAWASARTSPPASNPVRRAVVYPDAYTNYVLTDRGKAAVRALESLGVEVIVPEAPESGRAPLSQGMLATAEQKANGVHEALAKHIDDGYDVVVIEPSDLAMFKREYEKVLPAADYEIIAEHSFDVLEYVFGLLTQHDVDPEPLYADGRAVFYHAHCQQRTLGLDQHTIAVLERLGYDVETSSVECCGMAGSFGYKSEFYELSMDVGSDLHLQLEEADDRTVVASGTSCTEQIGALGGGHPQHPIELIAPR